MEKMIVMLAIAWVPQSDGTMKEAWRIEEQASVRHCLQMQSVFAGGGKAGAITVKCGDFKTIDALDKPERCSDFMRGFNAFWGRRC